MLAGCSVLRAEGFSISVDVLYWGLGISKLQFLHQNKIIKKFVQLYFFLFNFWSSKPWIRVEYGSVSGSGLSSIAGSATLVRGSVADPNPDPPDPHVFGPPGSGSTSQMCGSGSFYHHAKMVRKTMIPNIFWLLNIEKWCKCRLKKE